MNQGAFTGAGKMHKGRFEEAHGGTLFLDEIGLVPMEVQEKILRTVEYGRFSRVGSSTELEVDVRIIGATNADLPALCREGKFKRDLLDRLSFEVLYLPPLRCRSTDILLLAGHFAMRMAREMGKPEVPEFSPELIEKIQDYSWPGNIRELKNTVERAVYKTDGPLIEEINLNPFNNPYLTESPEPPDDPVEEDIPLANYRDYILEVELKFIRRALQENRFSQKKAADTLGLTYDQFRGLYKKYQSYLNDDENAAQEP